MDIWETSGGHEQGGTPFERLLAHINWTAHGRYGTELVEVQPGHFTTGSQKGGQLPQIVEQHARAADLMRLLHRVWIEGAAASLRDSEFLWVQSISQLSGGSVVEAELGWCAAGDQEGVITSMTVGRYKALMQRQTESHAGLHTKLLGPDEQGWGALVACHPQLVQRYMSENPGTTEQSAIDLLLGDIPEKANHILEAADGLRSGTFDEPPEQ